MRLQGCLATHFHSSLSLPCHFFVTSLKILHLLYFKYFLIIMLIFLNVIGLFNR